MTSLFILIVGLLVVPQLGGVRAAAASSTASIGLNGTFPAVWLAHTGFGMPLAIYILRNYMATPAQGDHRVGQDRRREPLTRRSGGSSCPMSVPALASFAIFQFLWVWNDLLVALLFLGPGENQPLTVALAGLVGSQGRAGSCSRPAASSRWWSRWWSSSPCSATSSAG